MNPEVVIIGGGPAGSTLATYLARAGISTLLAEKEQFPRFHIGESLLPASTPILEELGVYPEVKEQFIHKPGGCWLYDGVPVMSRFADRRPSASFNKNPDAFLVRRADLDLILLNNARKAGVDVHIPAEIKNIQFDTNQKITGLELHEGEKVTTLTPTFVFDCSGYMSLIPHALDLKDRNSLKRMALFSHYEVEILDERSKEGWFVGEMMYDGWLWFLPLTKNTISLGLVTSMDRFDEVAAQKETFLDDLLRKSPFAQKGLANLKRTHEEMHLYPNLGYTTKKLFGPNWALGGDTAFFIDPCYSTGFHMAVASARMLAQAYISRRSAPALQKDLARYERTMRSREKKILMMVSNFYRASKSRLLRKLVPHLNVGPLYKDFVHFTGGDFDYKPFNIYFSTAIHIVVGWFYQDRKPAWVKR